MSEREERMRDVANVGRQDDRRGAFESKSAFFWNCSRVSLPFIQINNNLLFTLNLFDQAHLFGANACDGKKKVASLEALFSLFLGLSETPFLYFFRNGAGLIPARGLQSWVFSRFLTVLNNQDLLERALTAPLGPLLPFFSFWPPLRSWVFYID